MHYSQLVTVASALALAPTAVIAKQAGAAFVTVNTLDTCPKGVAQEILKPGPKVVTTAYTCEQIKISHGLDVSYYSFDVEPLTKDTVTSCRAVKVYDNTACQGFPTLWIPFDSPLEDRCIPERVFSDEVKAISVQLDCAEPPAKKELPSPKQVAEQFAEQVQQLQQAQQAQQAEQAPKKEAQQGSKQEEAAPKKEQEREQGSKQEEAAPKQEQEREQGSEQEEQDEQDPEAAPEKKAANPADSLGLGELTKMLGFR